MLLRHLIIKTELLESKIITSLRAGILSHACETHSSKQNGTAAF
jgi:hypothetical protein